MPNEESRERPSVAPQEVRGTGMESRERPAAPLERPQQKEASPMAEPSASAPVAAAVPVAAIAKDAYRMKIERVLENGLVEIYVSLSPEKRAAFKRKGEETATKIRVLLDRTKISFGKVLDLIRDWLKTIPRVNRYFLEQEAKIKTDRIVLIHADLQRENALRV